MGVHGYLREHINKIKYLNLPYDLIELITIWYGTIDYWNINNTHSSYKFIKYNNSIIRNKSYDGLCYHTYGSLKITKSDIKIWKLQLLSMDNLCTDLTPLIGIINNKKIDSNLNGDFCDIINNGYGISCFKGCKYYKQIQGFSYGSQIKINDIIIMELNMTNPKNCTLTYKINRNGIINDYGYAFKKINPNIEW
eukprot:358151_1